jgi:hypothetical protein
MHKSIYLFPAIVLVTAGVALAKLPAPTPEEQAATVEKKKRQDEQLKIEKGQLDKAQDRVVRRYRQEHGGRPGGTTKRTQEEDLPKTTGELPGGVGPKPDHPASGEAHSAPAK